MQQPTMPSWVRLRGSRGCLCTSVRPPFCTHPWAASCSTPWPAADCQQHSEQVKPKPAQQRAHPWAASCSTPWPAAGAWRSCAGAGSGPGTPMPAPRRQGAPPARGRNLPGQRRKAALLAQKVCLSDMPMPRQLLPITSMQAAPSSSPASPLMAPEKRRVSKSSTSSCPWPLPTQQRRPAVRHGRAGRRCVSSNGLAAGCPYRAAAFVRWTKATELP